MAAPTDGYGIYEAISPDNSNATARLTQIAQGGFKLVMNYNLLFATAANITSYINFAASAGLKVIVSLENPAIWRDNAIAATFPELFADSGNQSTDSGFTTYVVNLVKSLAGTWGYYVGDEPLTVDHAALLAHCNIVHTADSVKPRLLIETAERAANAVYTNNSPFFDCCEVTGDDYYPVGNTLISWPSTATVASGIQATCALHGNQSAIALQAESLGQYARQTCAPWPTCTSWPTLPQMQQMHDDALTNMAPRVILWYSYFDVLAAPGALSQWCNLIKASNNVICGGQKKMVALVQQNTAASAAASPTSITPTLGAASTPGTLLLLVVAVTGTTPTITNPAGWTLLSSNNPTGLIRNVYALPKNAGGITAVAVTVGGTGGGAVAAIFEFSGLGNYVFDQLGVNNSAGSASYNTPFAPATSAIGEFLFLAVAFAATTLTPVNSNEWSSVIGAVVSTNGTPNAQLACFWGVSDDGSTPTISGTFGISVVNTRIWITYVITGTQQTVQTPIGGLSGQYVGQFFQGMVGG